MQYICAGRGADLLTLTTFKPFRLTSAHIQEYMETRPSYPQTDGRFKVVVESQILAKFWMFNAMIDPKVCNWSGIPREIRDLIYTFTLGLKLKVRYSQRHYGSVQMHTATRLKMVCHAFKLEVEDYIYKNATIHFTDLGDLHRWLNRIPPYFRFGVESTLILQFGHYDHMRMFGGYFNGYSMRQPSPMALWIKASNLKGLTLILGDTGGEGFSQVTNNCQWAFVEHLVSVWARPYIQGVRKFELAGAVRFSQQLRAPIEHSINRRSLLRARERVGGWLSSTVKAFLQEEAAKAMGWKTDTEHTQGQIGLFGPPQAVDTLEHGTNLYVYSSHIFLQHMANIT